MSRARTATVCASFPASQARIVARRPVHPYEADTFAEPVRRYSALEGSSGTFAVNGLSCFAHSARHSDTSEVQVRLPRHVFACTLRGQRDEIVEDRWDERRYTSRRLSGYGYSLIVPKEHGFVSKRRGNASHEYIVCEIEHSAFARVLGEKVGEFSLEPYFGPSPMANGIAERLEALCQAPNTFPLAYAESLASIFIVELFSAFASKPVPLDVSVSKGPKRFQHVLDFIEESLDHDISLFELAALAGLSVTHFAHAFKAAYGVAPYRYIARRRIERAKTLLRTTTETISMIAARCGFASQSRFAETFAKITGATPSAYRSIVHDN